MSNKNFIQRHKKLSYAIITVFVAIWFISALSFLDSSNAPTVTPTPPKYDTKDQAYLNIIAEINGVNMEAFNNLSVPFGRAADSPHLITDDEWVLEVGTSMGVLSYNADRIQSLTPPDKFTEAHGKLVLYAETIKEAIGLIGSGIDDKDFDRIEQGAGKVVEASGYTDEATKLFGGAL